jgi:hypothetical protein
MKGPAASGLTTREVIEGFLGQLKRSDSDRSGNLPRSRLEAE